MRPDAIWSTELGCYIAPESRPEINKLKTVNLGLCEIVITSLGYFYLYYRNKKLRELTFKEYLMARDNVKAVIGGELLT